MSQDYYRQIKSDIPNAIWSRSSSYTRDTDLDLSTQSEGYITATVQGSAHRPYQVKITQILDDEEYEYDATCTCPYNQNEGVYCKHIGAVIRKARAIGFDFDEGDDWEDMDDDEIDIINQGIEQFLAQNPKANIEKLVKKSSIPVNPIDLKTKYLESILDLSQKSNTKEKWYPGGQIKAIEGHYLGYNLSIIPIVSAKPNSSQYALELETLKINRKNNKPSPIKIDALVSRLNREGSPYVTDADEEFLNNKIFETSNGRSYYYSYSNSPNFVLEPNQLSFLFSSLLPTGKFYINNVLIVSNLERGSIVVKFDERDGEYYPMPQIEYISEKPNHILNRNDMLIGDNGFKYMYCLADSGRGNFLVELQNNEGIEMLGIMIKPPEGGFQLNDVKKISALAEESKIVHLPEKAKIQTIQMNNPKTKIVLREVDDMLNLSVGYEYPGLDQLGIALVYPDGNPTKYALKDSNGDDYYAKRDMQVEMLRSEAIASIVGSHNLDYDIDEGQGEYQGSDAVKVIFEVLPKLEAKVEEFNLEIYGQDGLKKHNYLKANTNFKLKSGIDWLSISGDIQFGDMTINMATIAKLIKRKERFIQIGSSIGVLPQEWLDKHREIFELGEINGDGELQVSKWHLSILSDFDQTLQSVDNKRESWGNVIRECLNWEDVKPLPMPDTTQATLRPYQQYGFEWLNFLYTNRLGGILADDMGLGKTLQTITFLDNLYNSKLLFTPKPEKSKKPTKANLPPIGQTLLVLPTSLIINWQMELAKFAPMLTFDLLYGNKRNKDMIQNSTANILITTYGTLLRDIEELKQKQFECVILDEAQQIKNSESLTFKAIKLIKARFRLSLSGTPVENSLGDLWSQFSFLNPGMLGSKNYFKNNFITSSDPVESAKRLQQLTYPFILRRLKQDVAKELGDKIENTVYVEMDPAQAKIYNQLREFYQTRVQEDMVLNTQNAKFRVLEGLTKLRQMCSHPKLLDPESLISSAKLDLMLQKLDEVVAEKHNVLIFSQFTSMLSIIQDKLKERGVPYCYLDGKTKKRQEEVDKFQDNPDIPVFLLSLKAGGVGLNLTAADYVFIFDPWWNPASENQAIDRAHRIGQGKTVFVYRFVVKDTVEEKILELQETKQNMVKNIITADESLIKSLDKKAIGKLFS